MSRKKVLNLLEICGGNASTRQLRSAALKEYPKMSLHRTLHTTLKQLVNEGKVRHMEDLDSGDRWEIATEPLVTHDKIATQAEQDMKNYQENIEKISMPSPPDAEPYDDNNNEEEEDPTRPGRFKYEKDKFKYRDKHEIACSIVEAIHNGRTRTTAIMYSSWLSHYQLQKYLSALLVNDLIVQTDKNKYAVTPKGIEFMEAMKKVSQIKFD